MTITRLLTGSMLLAALAGCAGVPIDPNPDRAFKEGEELFQSEHYDDAIAQYKKVLEAFANPEITTTSELRIADAHFASERYVEAAAAYEEFRKLHPNHAKSDFALYRMGMANFNMITGEDHDQTPQKNALIHFDELLAKYPKSEHAADAKRKIAEIKTMLLKHELYIARFYYNTGKYKAAIRRLEAALESHPGSPLHDETWFLIAACQLKSGDPAIVREAFTKSFNKLSSQYPDSTYILEATKLLEKYY